MKKEFILLILVFVLGISAGILYPYTPAGWWYIASAIKDVCIMTFASIISSKYLGKNCQIISDAGLVLSIGALLDELFFLPTVPQANDYIILIIIILWTLKTGLKK
jgi:hypothetical protein